MEQAGQPVSPRVEAKALASSSDPKDRLVVALDVSRTEDALALADALRDQCRWMKVGMELFYAGGRDLVRRLQDRGFLIFLDLKIHDIPNTAAAAVRSVSDLRVQILTVHTAGGPAMLEAVAAQASSLPSAPLLAGVTVLTSMDQSQLAATGVSATPEEQVLRLAVASVGSGLAGLVASPLEVPALRRRFGPDLVLIVPGIRPPGSESGDQRRTATPTQAIRDGASLLVVGRPITRASEPARAAEAVLDEIAVGISTQL